MTNQGGPDIVRVVEPVGEGSPELLEELLREDKQKVEHLIAEHGAVLFRGFKVDPPRFREAVLSVYHIALHLDDAHAAETRAILLGPASHWLI